MGNGSSFDRKMEVYQKWPIKNWTNQFYRAFLIVWSEMTVRLAMVYTLYLKLRTESSKSIQEPHEKIVMILSL